MLASPALAEENSPQGEDSGIASTAPEGTAAQQAAIRPTSVSASATSQDEMSDEDRLLLEMAQGEVIEVYAERPDKPFDRDTIVRLTGEELARRGATNLADALALVPEINVRTSGRGGRILDIRGARKGAITILIDGVAVADPYYGTFDVSSIPVTDIVQIRVSSSPGSPIDGVGGPGGVVEVHTRDAIGARRVDARMQGSSLPEALFSATGRARLGDHLAVRPSVAVSVGAQDFQLLEERIGESRQEVTGAIRLEYRRGTRRVVADAQLQKRSFVVPPSEELFADIRVVEDENSARVGVIADDELGAWRVQGNSYAQVLTRRSMDYAESDAKTVFGQASAFENFRMDRAARLEDLMAARAGAGFLANRSLHRRFQIIGSATFVSEFADVTNTNLMSERQRGISTTGYSHILETAGGLQWEDGPFRVESAAGVAVPIGLGATPWPELKATAWYRATPSVRFKMTGAHKGRLPTLRERYQSNVGNESLDPEKSWFGEAAVEITPHRLFRLESASYVRDSSGTIVLGTDSAGAFRLVNLGALTMRGIDVALTVAPERALSAGGSLGYISPGQLEDGEEPLDFLPRARADMWLTAQHGDGLSATARVRFTSEQEDQGHTLPSYTLADFSAFARLGHGLCANLRIENLLDERYPIRAGVTSPGRVTTLSLSGGWE